MMAPWLSAKTVARYLVVRIVCIPFENVHTLINGPYSALDHPEPWNIWRQAADKNEIGLAAGPEFWDRVRALGDRPYYPPPDLPGF